MNDGPNAMLTLADVLQGLGADNTNQAPKNPVTKVVADSRKVKPGSLFVALPGERTDGHNYVINAFKAGAIATLIDKDIETDYPIIDMNSAVLPPNLTAPFCLKVPNALSALQQLAKFWRDKFPLRVVAITGSVGKTSTKELTHLVLSQKYTTFKSEGNLNSEIGLPLTLLELNSNYEAAVLEMGMYQVGEIRELCQIAQPQVGVISNIGPSHLERLGSMDKIVAAKRELVESLDEQGVAILNADDALVLSMRNHTPARIFSYGLSQEADLRADNITSEGLEGIRFVFHYQGKAIHVRVPLLGRHSVHTALRAAAVGLVEGLGWDEIVAGLQNETAQLRLVAIPGPNESLLLDDTYNASPASTLAALNLLHELEGVRKIAVLGYMAELGAYEAEGHRKVGCRAADIANELIIIGPKADLIAEEAIACGLKRENVHQIEEASQALTYLQNIASPGDVILIKGSRSLAMESIVAGLSTPVDG